MGRPFELSIGELQRFFDNQVWHYTVHNETDVTRVSIDFRVIREQEWSPASFESFQLGGHYSVMTAHGILPRTSEELKRLREEYRCLGPPKRKPKPRDPLHPCTPSQADLSEGGMSAGLCGHGATAEA